MAQPVKKPATARAGAGRPRSEPSRKAILDATRKLLTRLPLAQLTVDAIAAKAGAGKTTIYRWWPNKAAVALEAFLEQQALRAVQPTTATAAEAVTRQLEALLRQLRGVNGRIMAGLIAESQADAAVLDLLYEKFLKERVEILTTLIEQGRASGEFRATLDTTIAVDLLLGPLFLRVLSGEHGIDNHFAAHYPVQAVAALGG